MTETVPTIEIANDAHAGSIGSPHHKMNSADAINGTDMGAKTVVGLVQRSFGKEVQIEVR
jgi:hypothetical protein